MKKEIRKDVREYILSKVNESLSRLGVSEKVVDTKEFEDRCQGTLHYEFESSPIRQSPMLFKELFVKGYMVSIEEKEDSSLYEQSLENDIVVVNIEYAWKSFRGGSNGTDLGRMIFFVKKKLPESFKDKTWGNSAEVYIYKYEGLEI